MIFKKLWFFIIISLLFCVNNTYAFENCLVEDASDTKAHNKTSADSTNKRRRSDDKENTPPKRRKITPEDSPRTIAKIVESDQFYYPRKEFARLGYKDGPTRSAISTPEVCKVYEKYPFDKAYYRSVTIDGKTFYQGDFLYDPYAEVLRNGEWKTNVEWMEEGFCPIGHRGISKKRKGTHQQIEKKQRKHRIEVHHLTQKAIGPFCEMTHPAHMGIKHRAILEFDAQTQQIRIVHTNLKKSEAEQLCGPNQFIVTNLLHRKKKSEIDREEFNEIRTEYWKLRAQEIKDAQAKNEQELKTVKKQLIFEAV